MINENTKRPKGAERKIKINENKLGNKKKREYLRLLKHNNMTKEQQQENETLQHYTYLLNVELLNLKPILTQLKGEKINNTIKHHQSIMNLDYSYEIIQRAVELLQAAKNK